MITREYLQLWYPELNNRQITRLIKDFDAEYNLGLKAGLGLEIVQPHQHIDIEKARKGS